MELYKSKTPVDYHCDRNINIYIICINRTDKLIDLITKSFFFGSYVKIEELKITVHSFVNHFLKTLNY